METTPIDTHQSQRTRTQLQRHHRCLQELFALLLFLKPPLDCFANPRRDHARVRIYQTPQATTVDFEHCAQGLHMVRPRCVPNYLQSGSYLSVSHFHSHLPSHWVCMLSTHISHQNYHRLYKQEKQKNTPKSGSDPFTSTTDLHFWKFNDACAFHHAGSRTLCQCNTQPTSDFSDLHTAFLPKM